MSKIEVDAIDKQSGSTLTLGGSGTAVTLACGATQSGFGRTGTVDWVTSVKTNSDSPLTVANGKGYFLNTTSGTITVNLPAGSAGDIVAFKDYANTWDDNNVTITPNGSDKINGFNASAVLSTESQSLTLIFVYSTKFCKCPKAFAPCAPPPNNCSTNINVSLSGLSRPNKSLKTVPSKSL